MSRLKWNYFKLSHTVIPDGKNYDIIVYEDGAKEFYFFGYAILWCLGYEVPHVSLQSLVPEEERHNVPNGNGIFIHESTVQRLITERKKNSPHPHYDAFENWFQDYLKNCKGTNPSSHCPH